MAAVPKAAAVSLERQIKAARRELKLRRDVYPSLVRGGRMNQFTAEDEIQAMASIVATLEGLVDARRDR